MQSHKKQDAAKGAAEAFGIAASVTTFIFDVVGSFFKIPALFKWIGAAVVGLIGACIGGRNAYNAAEEKEKNEKEALDLMHEERMRMIELMSRPQVGHHHKKRRHSHHGGLSTGAIQAEVGLGNAAAVVNHGPAEVKMPALSPRNDRLFRANNPAGALELVGVEADEKRIVYQRR